MNKGGKKGGSILYRFDPDGTWHVANISFDLPNGWEWSRDDRTLCFADSHTSNIYACDLDAASGTIENRRLFFSMAPAEGKSDRGTSSAYCLMVRQTPGSRRMGRLSY